MLKQIVMLGMIVMNASAMAYSDKVMRAKTLNADFLNKIHKEQVENVVVEFIEGDRLPVMIRAEGDLFESVDNNPTYVEVKKHFFVRIMKSDITMSFDGKVFKPIQELLGGTLTVNASGGNIAKNFPVSVINVMFSTFIK